MDLEEEAAAAARAAAEASGAATDQRDPAELATDAELKRALRDGRALLKEETEPAFKRSLELFEKALTLARMVGDTTQTRRATRGLAASKRGLGDRKGAIKNLKEVLEMRQLVGDAAGDTDALGAIADIYTELGDLENAGKYYDLYLDALNNEMMS
jgi:tetratricopeptide (TPR) repeat protein